MVERLSRTDVLEYWYIETAVSLLEESIGVIGTSELPDRNPPCCGWFDENQRAVAKGVDRMETV